MNIISTITLSKTIHKDINASIIPILLSKLKTKTLFEYVSRFIPIPKHYNTLLNTIEDNMKENNLGMANLTIEYNNINNNNNNSNSIINNTKKTKKSKQIKSKQIKSKQTKSQHTKSKHTKQINTIHQLFIIPINDLSYNKKDDSELLELARVSGNAMFNRLKNNKIVKVNIIDTLDTISNETTYIEAIMEGLLLSSYRFLTYKTNNSLTKKKDTFEIKKIHLVLPSYKRDIHKDSIIDKLQKLINQIKSVFLTRDLINEPANATKINLFISTVKNYIKENNIPIKLKVLDKDDLEKLKMGLILGVGKASLKENEPKIMILEYDGIDSKNKKNSPDYVLLGKGITFDTGGTNLKRGRSLIEMKTDMSGAAVVASFLLGYAMNKGSKNIYAMCPLVENNIGSGAIKPSDVLTSYSGKTVEITNTDAEGRLILADVLSYISTTYPKSTIIDFATLTGQQEQLSCKMFSNILSSNSESEVKTLIEKGKHINEALVELPMMDKHLSKLKSYVADIRNASFSCSADIIMSSLFMKQFINKNTKWIHIDIAGQSYKTDNIIKYASPEASGVGVRLLFAYFE
jgi:leucyl aminopeptidase